MAMDDWKQYTQSVVFGLVFSFLLAKLFAIIFSFRDENPSEEVPPLEPHWKSVEEDKIPEEAEFPKNRISNSSIENEEPLIDQKQKVAETGSDSDDDWEGVESTELDEAFCAASAFVAATAADRSSSRKVSNDLKLQLYGLYKIATEGPCSVPQPSAIKMNARIKWNSWHKLGAMPTEEAMHKYIEIITELFPNWADGVKSKTKTEDSDKPTDNNLTPMGTVFTPFAHEETENELKMDAIHDFESGVSVDTNDSEGRTPLHLAVDHVVEKDDDGS